MKSFGVEVRWDHRGQLVSSTWKSCKLRVFELGLGGGVKNGDEGVLTEVTMCAKS